MRGSMKCKIKQKKNKCHRCTEYNSEDRGRTFLRNL